MKPTQLEAIRWFREAMEDWIRRFPELKSPEAQKRTEQWLDKTAKPPSDDSAEK